MADLKVKTAWFAWCAKCKTDDPLKRDPTKGGAWVWKMHTKGEFTYCSTCKSVLGPNNRIPMKVMKV